MLVTLTPHPLSPCPALDRIEVEMERVSEGRLSLAYSAFGDIERIVVPGWTKRSRADELWRTTCFEAFVRGRDEGYFEFNLSPSGQWAAYGFDAYREGMRSVDGVELSGGEPVREEGRLGFSANLDLDRLGLSFESHWRLALSTVIEATDGTISYWALAHPSAKPDFHHPDSFVLDLP